MLLFYPGKKCNKEDYYLTIRKPLIIIEHFSLVNNHNYVREAKVKNAIKKSSDTS